MKRDLVKFNRPLLLRIVDDSGEYYKPVYGFFGLYSTDDEEEYQEHQQDYMSYSSYLAAIHEWSNNISPGFTISDLNAHWIDETGQEHIYDDWVLDICSRSATKLGLDSTTYEIDLEEVIRPWNRLIFDESYMDYLVGKVESPEDSLIEKTVFLFNRPLWFSDENLCGEEGYCQVYGVISDDELGEELKSDITAHLGYLAMCEEYNLAGITPSGFTTQDGETWYRDGIEYDVNDEEIVEEGRICREKHNLKVIVTVTNTPEYELKEGVKGDLIIGQGLYEYLLDIAKFRLQLDVRNRLQ